MDESSPGDDLSGADDDLSGVLDDAFPDRTVDRLDPAGPSWNAGNHTVRVAFADGSAAYLKTATDGDDSRIARERAVIDYVDAHCEVRVPEVLASGLDRETPYLATAPLAGEGLHLAWSDGDRRHRERLARRVGWTLADLHARRFDAHGHVVGGGADGLELEAGDWTDVLVDTIEDTRSRAVSDRFDHHFDRVIDAVEANRDLLEAAPAALLHGDPAKPNFVVGEGGPGAGERSGDEKADTGAVDARGTGRVGVLDWEIAHVGDPVRELVRVRDQQLDSVRTGAPEGVVSALHDGYRERSGGLPGGFEDRRPVYEAVRFLGVSGFFENVVEYLDESAEKLAAWASEEFERRIAAAREPPETR